MRNKEEKEKMLLTEMLVENIYLGHEVLKY